MAVATDVAPGFRNLLREQHSSGRALPSGDLIALEEGDGISLMLGTFGD